MTVSLPEGRMAGICEEIFEGYMNDLSDYAHEVGDEIGWEHPTYLRICRATEACRATYADTSPSTSKRSDKDQ